MSRWRILLAGAALGAVGLLWGAGEAPAQARERCEARQVGAGRVATKCVTRDGHRVTATKRCETRQVGRGRVVTKCR